MRYELGDDPGPDQLAAGSLLPTRWLNFRGDRRAAIGQVVGPTLHGRWLTIVTATYNEDLDRTHVGLVYGRRTVGREVLP